MNESEAQGSEGLEPNNSSKERLSPKQDPELQIESVVLPDPGNALSLSPVSTSVSPASKGVWDGSDPYDLADINLGSLIGERSPVQTPLRSNVSKRSFSRNDHPLLQPTLSSNSIPEEMENYKIPEISNKDFLNLKAQIPSRKNSADSQDGSFTGFGSLGGIEDQLQNSLSTSDEDSSGGDRESRHRRKVSWGGVTLEDDALIFESLEIVDTGNAETPSVLANGAASVASAADASDADGSGLSLGPDTPRVVSAGSLGSPYKFAPPQNGRRSLVPSLETGQEGVRGHRAVVRHQSRWEPQSKGARRRRGLQKLGEKFANPFWGVSKTTNSAASDDLSRDSTSVHGRLMVNHFEVDEEEDDEEMMNLDNSDPEIGAPPAAARKKLQYRLQAIDYGRRKSFFQRQENVFEEISTLRRTVYEDTVSFKNDRRCCGFRPNFLVISYLNWTFRSSFVSVALSALAGWFSLSFGFALMIMAIGYQRPDCVHVNGQDFGTTGAEFLDAYALSWTTFSTVGYGLIFPGTSNVSSDVRECTGITILMTLESFVGILFASMWGAILFAKVTRVASFAQVEFSDALVIRFGVGVANLDEMSSSEDEAGNGSSNKKSNYKANRPPIEERKEAEFKFKPSKLPCPLLEFRVMNLRATQHGGEIIDAHMTVVGSIHESQASTSLKNSVVPRRRLRRGRRRRRMFRRPPKPKTSKSKVFGTPSLESLEKAQESIRNLISNSRPNQTIDEDPSGKFIPKRIFAKLEIDPEEHPFFKRIWLARHVLNEHSPLLKQEAKELIRLNAGHWPIELNSSEGIRASICFDQIVVSLSGVSNADANSVYAQKVYDYVDLCVGYRFCDLLFREADGSIGVDRTLLNDVREQRGGGGEDLNASESNGHKTPQDIVIL